MKIIVKEFKFSSFSLRQRDSFRLNRGVVEESVDTTLTRDESENRKQLEINYLRFHGGAQNRSNQMKGYALLWKQVRVLEKLTIY